MTIHRIFNACINQDGSARLTTWYAATLLALCLHTVVQAQVPETPQQRRAAAQALVKTMDDLMGSQRMVGAMRAAMQAPLEQQLRAASHLSLQQRDRAVAVLSDAMGSTLGEWVQDMMPSLYATMTDIYVERFTLAEIQELRRFYDSSAGRKSVTVMQEDMPRLMAPMMQNMQSRAPQLKERMDAAAQRLEQEGIRLKPPGQ